VVPSVSANGVAPFGSQCEGDTVARFQIAGDCSPLDRELAEIYVLENAELRFFKIDSPGRARATARSLPPASTTPHPLVEIFTVHRSLSG